IFPFVRILDILSNASRSIFSRFSSFLRILDILRPSLLLLVLDLALDLVLVLVLASLSYLPCSRLRRFHQDCLLTSPLSRPCSKIERWLLWADSRLSGTRIVPNWWRESMFLSLGWRKV